MLGLGVILNFVTAILSFFIPESPKYLFGKERFDECRQSLKTIASRNGVSDFKPPIFLHENTLHIEIDDEDDLAMIQQTQPDRLTTMKESDAHGRATDKNFDHLKASVTHATESHNNLKPTEVGKPTEAFRSTRMTKKTVVDVVQAHIRATKAGFEGSRYMTMTQNKAVLTTKEMHAKVNETNNLRDTS
jgi:hypothetical protein